MTANNTAWDEVRTTCPVAWTPHNGGHWVISGYEEVAEAFRDWETFSSARTDPTKSSITISGSRLPLLVPEELDPPEWHGYRRVLAAMLSPQAAERLRPRARHWARHCIDTVIESGRCELVSELIFPVPAAVTLEWLGFPESDWASFSHAFHDAAAYPHGSPEYQAAAAATVDVMRRVTEEIDARWADGRGDGLSAIAQAEIDGERISRKMAEATDLHDHRRWRRHHERAHQRRAAPPAPAPRRPGPPPRRPRRCGTRRPRSSCGSTRRPAPTPAPSPATPSSPAARCRPVTGCC